MEHFQSGVLMEAWNQWTESMVCSVSQEQHWDSVFQLVRTLTVDAHRVKFRFLGQPVCRDAWCKLAHISHGALVKFQHAVREGAVERPEDGRRFNGGVPEAPESVHAFLENLYTEVAEWMPDDDASTTFSNARSIWVPPPSMLSDWLAAPAVEGPSTLTSIARHGRRHLPHSSIMDLYLDYKARFHEPARFATFLRTFRSWRTRLVFAKASQHSKCPDCEHFKELNRRSTSFSDQAQVLQAYRLHLAAQYRDRNQAALLAHHSRQSFAGERPVSDSTMYMCMDGMDQAKFRVPRNTSQSKDLVGRQRPQIHCVGAIVDGLADFFYFNDFRVSKDANLQITLTARTLGVVADLLAGRPGVAMPRHLVLHSDNAAGEGKHQTVMKFCAWLVWRGTFDTVTMTQFRVGHTHNQQDQRFGILAHALNAAAVLEDRARF